MLSWITGARITDVAEELGDAAYVEPPETPAPVFAVRAFKHAVWGTPAHEEPETKPAGILMTPRTAGGRRKTVSFGAHVVDNEGKKSAFATKTGLPSNYPGKFPSPWTPKTSVPPESKSRTKLTAALYNARESENAEEKDTAKAKPNPAPAPQAASAAPEPAKPLVRAKDDTDITTDVLEPRSESGRYWKEQYLSYAERSEKEVKKLVTKQQLAKRYAKKKDAEAMALATRLDDERKRHKIRERELEAQMKDYQERLRQSMAENLRCSAEIAALKKRLEDMEGSRSVDMANGEDSTKKQLSMRRSPTKTKSAPLRTNARDAVLARHEKPKDKITKPTTTPQPQAHTPSPHKQPTQLAPATAAIKEPEHEFHDPLASPAGDPRPPLDSRAANTTSRSVSETRVSLPPDRLEEAKARLAARRRGKENSVRFMR